MGLFCAPTIGPSNNDKQTENRRRYSVLEYNQSYFVVSHFFLQKKTFSSSNQAMERLFCLIMILQITLNDMFIKNNLQNRVLIEINLVYGNLFSLCTARIRALRELRAERKKWCRKN